MKLVGFYDFLFGIEWAPSDDIKTGKFGFLPILTGTAMITIIAVLISMPIALLISIYIDEYAPDRMRHFMQKLISVLAAVPTVVYGYAAVIFICPIVRDLFAPIKDNIYNENALSAGIAMGLMLIPSSAALFYDILRSVPKSIKYAGYALGSNKEEVIYYIALSYALPSLLGVVLMGFARGIGETMIVTMAAGLMANMTLNPLDPVSTVTAQIVNILTGDQDMEGIQTRSAYMIGLVLIMITYCISFVTDKVISKAQN